METNSRLTTLWKQRASLKESEWNELYRLTVSILSKSNPSILRSLPESKVHYIQDFFLHKVFEPAKHNSSCPYGANELCSYFNNYLLDVKRSAGLRFTEYVESYDEVERSCEYASVSSEPSDSEFTDYGYSHIDVYSMAQEFLRHLDDIGRIYLALHACADNPEPLKALSERLRIPSYHYRAQQLGITRKKGEYGDGYERTDIGKWLTQSLGLDLGANSAVLAALKILCLASLQEYQEKRS